VCVVVFMVYYDGIDMTTVVDHPPRA
jgi:hypothetical protein